MFTYLLTFLRHTRVVISLKNSYWLSFIFRPGESLQCFFFYQHRNARDVKNSKPFFFLFPSTSLWGIYSETLIHHYNVPLAHAFTCLCMTCTYCTLPLPLGHSVHVHPALCLFPWVTVYMYILHSASSPWSQCTCTSCTLPLPLGHSVRVHPALCHSVHSFRF